MRFLKRMGGWGRKTSDFCDKCAEVFPDLADGVRTTRALHAEVARRLSRFPGCERCFATYQRTVELCRRAGKQLPAESAERLLARLKRAASGE